MLISNFVFVVLVLAIVAMVFIQIFFGYTAAHPNYDGTKIRTRNQWWIYKFIAVATIVILFVVELSTVRVWGEEVIYYFGLGTSQQDQMRWVVLGVIACASLLVMFGAMLLVAKVAEYCGRNNIVLHRKYTIRRQTDNKHL